MAKVNFGSVQFQGRSDKNITIGPPGKTYTVGVAGPAGQYLSDAHKNARTSVNKSKLSYAAIALEYILQGHVAALEGNSNKQIYMTNY